MVAETIVFNGAIYRQDLRIELSPGARWLGWEITRLGQVPGEKGFAGGSGDRTLKLAARPSLVD